MRRLLLTLIVVCSMLLAVGVASASPKVSYTFTVADLGQGIWGGGSLFADGTAGGNVAFSAGNGAVIYHLHATSWAVLFPGALDVCFEVREIKGSSGLPPSFCISDFGLVLPVTGTPLLIDDDGDGNPDFVMRATPTN